MSLALEPANHTELYQTCRRLELPALPSMTREQLMTLILGGTLDESIQPAEVGTSQNIFDSWRHGLAGFVLAHWSILQNQVDCPLKTQDPKSCFKCLDTQVVDCVTANPANERLIQLHRK